MADEKQYTIGIDIGGTKIVTGIVDPTGHVIHRTVVPTCPDQGEEAVLAKIRGSVDQVIAESSINPYQIHGIGVATAGVIDSRNQVIVYSNNIGWNHVPIGHVLYEHIGIPVRLSNDANAAVVAEWIWGAGAGHHNVIFITVSTGIGAGIVSGGQLITGANDSAGEFGHISINVNGPECVCGNKGCLENYASGTAIAKSAVEHMQNYHDVGMQAPYLSQLNLKTLTAKDVIEAAEQGDSLAVSIIDEAGYYLGMGITNLIHLFNPEVVVLGGGVMTTGTLLLKRVCQTVEKHCLKSFARNVSIRRSALGIDIGVKGAAGLFYTEKSPHLKTSCR